VNPALQIGLAFGSVAALLGVMAVVRRLASAWQINAEVQRKLVHICTGLYAITLPWLFPDRWPVYVLVAVTLVIMLVLRLPNSRLGATLHGVERQSYGDFLLAISVGVCLFLAEDQLYLYVLPMAVLTLADAAAALTGTAYGTKFMRVEEGRKSIEGSVAFFAITLLISMVCLMLMTSFAPLNIIILSLMVAGFGTLVEAASWRGFDNLFLPVGLLIFLWAHGDSAMPELLTLAALFAFAAVSFKIIAPRFGLSGHAGQVYVTAIFLLLAVIDIQNATLPILVLAAHAWSRNAAPSDSSYPDLDIVAGLSLVSFGALIMGNAIGLTAISFYGLATMNMGAALCVIALGKHPIVGRVLGICSVVGVAMLIRAAVVAINPASANWNGPMWGAAVLGLALVVLIPALGPQVFHTKRAVKVTLLSILIPLPAYIVAVVQSGVF